MSDWPHPASLDELVLALVSSDPLIDRVDPSSSVAARRALADRIIATAPIATGGPRRGTWPRPRWWRPAVVATVGVVLVGSAAAAGVLLARRAPDPAAPVACRAEARLDASAVVVASADDPLTLCRSVWASGRLAPEGSGGPPDSIPPLVACVGQGGAVEVFPGGPDTCARLGLAPAVVASPASDPVQVLTDRLTAAIGPSCRSLDDAASLASQLFAELRLNGWTVERRPAQDASEVCARVAIESTTRRVVLVPGPRP